MTKKIYKITYNNDEKVEFLTKTIEIQKKFNISYFILQKLLKNPEEFILVDDKKCNIERIGQEEFEKYIISIKNNI